MKIEVINTNTPATIYERNERARIMFGLYLKGKTLNQVGDIYGVTRERVRQVISEFPDYKEHREKFGNNVEHPAEFIKKQCPTCFRGFSIPVYDENQKNKNYCSRRCLNQSFIDKWRNIKEKVCTRCEVLKPIEEFYATYSNVNPFERSSHCKKCHAILTIDWGKRNPEKKKEAQDRAVRKYRLKNRDKILERRLKNKDKINARQRERYHRLKSLKNEKNKVKEKE